MKRPFREHHLLSILNSFDTQNLPLDLFLRNYFRANHSVGSKDRKEICEKIYTLIRHRSLLDYLSTTPPSWESRYEALQKLDLKKLQNQDIPPHIRLSFPKAFYNLLVQSLGQEKAELFCALSNEQAPVTIRVNTLLISREAFFQKLQTQYPVHLCSKSSTAISFENKINFFAMEEFKQGLFEVQDEGSQLLSELVNACPKQWVLDYCAGAGGKTLAIAPKLQGSGQLFLHDIRHHALLEAKKRLKRAGIQNAQILPPDSPHKHTLKNRFDWVLVDAPCSGTGTLRRNPDMKWKFQEEMVSRLVQEQRTIFQEALAYVKPGGHIVYATCSVLPQENEEQARYFATQFPIEQIGQPFSCFPESGSHDGFFAICFLKKN